MKLKYRFYAIFAAIALLVSMSVSAFADQPALPDEDKDGECTITIHKYAVDSIGALTGRNTGDIISDGEVLYQDVEGGNVTLDDLEKLEGIPFRVERVRDGDDDPDTAQTYTGTGSYDENDVTGTGGTVTFEKLPFGVYRVTELAHSEVTKPMEPFLIHVPLTNPQRTGWLYDIHVYPKNELEGQPEIDKNIVDSGGNLIGSDTEIVGGTVTWQIDADIPGGIAISKVYTVTDILDSRLNYAGNLSVGYTDRDGATTSLTVDTDYTATQPATTGGGTLKVDFDQASMRQELAKALEGDDDYEPTLTIRFDTTINETAVANDQLGTEIPNSATLDFTNSQDKAYKEKSPEPEVHTGGLRIEKVDADRTATKLPGATFRLYKTLDDALAGTNPVTKPGESSAWEETSGDPDGIATFRGLAYGTYFLVEVKSPEGYNLLSAPQQVTVDGESHKETSQVEVKNKSGFVLPLTGGSGTVIFTVVGGVLIAGAAVLLFLSYRKNRSR